MQIGRQRVKLCFIRAVAWPKSGRLVAPRPAVSFACAGFKMLPFFWIGQFAFCVSHLWTHNRADSDRLIIKWVHKITFNKRAYSIHAISKTQFTTPMLSHQIILSVFVVPHSVSRLVYGQQNLRDIRLLFNGGISMDVLQVSQIQIPS